MFTVGEQWDTGLCSAGGELRAATALLFERIWQHRLEREQEFVTEIVDDLRPRTAQITLAESQLSATGEAKDPGA